MPNTMKQKKQKKQKKKKEEHAETSRNKLFTTNISKNLILQIKQNQIQLI